MPHTPEEKRLHRAKPEVRRRDREYQRDYYRQNREAILAKQRSTEEKARREARRRERYLSDPEYRAKQLENARKWKARNPDYKHRRNARWLKKRHAELAALAGRPRPTVCDACGRSDDRIVFDHCHKRGHFRGWLCDRCNRVLGVVADDSNVLIKLLAYLARTKGLVSPQLTLPGL